RNSNAPTPPLPGPVTATATDPGACAGVTAVIVVESSTTKDAAAAPPKVTPVPTPKPVPRIVTRVPPLAGPRTGARVDAVPAYGKGRGAVVFQLASGPSTSTIAWPGAFGGVRKLMLVVVTATCVAGRPPTLTVDRG